MVANCQGRIAHACAVASTTIGTEVRLSKLFLKMLVDSLTPSMVNFQLTLEETGYKRVTRGMGKFLSFFFFSKFEKLHLLVDKCG